MVPRSLPGEPAGANEVLFLSTASKWEAGKAIRGGIPICYPWFRAKSDDPKAPAHGFARTSEWAVDSVAQAGDAVVLTLSLTSSEATKRWWPHEFSAELKVTVGQTLALALTIRNTGEEAFRFEEALHTYHRVSDVEAITVLGLTGAAYLDNFDGNQAKVQREDLRFAGARDDAFASAASPLNIVDEALKRRLQIAKSGSQTTVVWNPWQESAAAMADLGGQQWREFACVEAANILDAAVMLMPGEQHTLAVDISVTHMN